MRFDKTVPQAGGYKTRMGVWSMLLFALSFCMVIYANLVLGFRHLPHDTRSFLYPWREYVSDCLRAGIFPFWDSLNSPGFAVTNLNSPVYYPLFTVMGTIMRYSEYVFIMEIVISVLIAFIGMYLWLRWRGSKQLVCISGATAFVGSGAFATNVQGVTIMGSIIYIPWILYCLEILIYKDDARSFWYSVLLLVFSGWFMFTGGYIAMSYPIIIFSLIYILPLTLKRPTCCIRLMSAGAISLCLVFMLTYLSISLYMNHVEPFMAVLRGKEVFNPFKEALTFNSVFTMLLANSVYIPNIVVGRAEQMYFGLPMFVFSLMGVVFLGNSNRARLYLFMALFIFLASLSDSCPVAKWFVAVIPGLDWMRYHCMWSVIVVFFLITLGAMFFEGLIAGRWELSIVSKKLVYVIGVLLVTVMVAPLLLIVLKIGQHSLPTPVTVTLWEIIVSVIILFFSLACMVIMLCRCFIGNSTVCCGPVSVALSILLLMIILLTVGNAGMLVTGNRLISLDDIHVKVPFIVMYGVDVFQFSVVSVLLLSIVHFGGRFSKECLLMAFFCLIVFDLVLASQRYYHGNTYWKGVRVDSAANRSVEYNKNIRILGTTDDFQLNERAPRSISFTPLFDPRLAGIRQQPGGQELFSSMLRFLPAGNPMHSISAWTNSGVEPDIKEICLKANRLTAEIEVKEDGCLMWTDAASIGWRTILDGAEVAMCSPMGIFKGVKLNKGRHQVVFEFQPVHLRQSIILFIFSVLFLAAVALVLLRSRAPSSNNMIG